MGQLVSRICCDESSKLQIPDKDIYQLNKLKEPFSYIQTHPVSPDSQSQSQSQSRSRSRSRSQNQAILLSRPPPYQSRRPSSSSSQRISWFKYSTQCNSSSNKKPQFLQFSNFMRKGTRQGPGDLDTLLQAFLQKFNLVFVVDDSTSMCGGRWEEVESALADIVRLCAKHNNTINEGNGNSSRNSGIDLYFLNHRFEPTLEDNEDSPDPGIQEPGKAPGGYTNLTTPAQIHSIFKRVRPRGPTPFGIRLYHILAPYLRQLENSIIATYALASERACTPYRASFPVSSPTAAAAAAGDIYHPKPLYIINITDGGFTDDAENVLLQAMSRLDGCGTAAPAWQVCVQFFQVGGDYAAREALVALESGLRWGRKRRDLGDRDILMVDPVVKGRARRPSRASMDGCGSGGVVGNREKLSAEGVVGGIVRAVKWKFKC